MKSTNRNERARAGIRRRAAAMQTRALSQLPASVTAHWAAGWEDLPEQLEAHADAAIAHATAKLREQHLAEMGAVLDPRGEE